MSGLFICIRFAMALLTVLALAVKPFIPPKTLLIYPQEGVETGIFGPVVHGRETVSVLNEQQTAWRCDYPERYYELSCGLVIDWNLPLPADGVLKTIDASEYDGFRMHMVYEGRSDYLRLYLNNHNPAHRAIRPNLSAKHMVALLNTDELRSGPAFVSLQRFRVEEWWLISQNPPRQIAGPEFEHLVRLGIDSVDPGVHRVHLHKIELIGKRIGNETYLLLILAFWTLYLLLEAGLHYWQLKQTAGRQREQLHRLAGESGNLTQPSDAFIDPLTDCHNRNGLRQHVQRTYGGNFLPSDTSLIAMAIDGFDTLADVGDQKMADATLKAFSALILKDVRAHDIVARWGNKTFLLLVADNSAFALQRLAEKLRLRVATHHFPAAPRGQITISLGIAHAGTVESFDSLLERAILALKEAQKTRNSVVCAGAGKQP